MSIVTGSGAKMSNQLEQAIDCNDGEQAAKIIQGALGIESDGVVNYVFLGRPIVNDVPA
jgi:hypothetical protein